MTYGFGDIAGLVRIAAAGATALLAAVPTAAAAGEARATLSVSATVVPSCRIDQEDALRHAVACSSAASFSTTTVTRRDEKPLHEAALILGTPVRGARGIEFAAPVRPAAAAGNPDATTRYLTITY